MVAFARELPQVTTSTYANSIMPVGEIIDGGVWANRQNFGVVDQFNARENLNNVINAIKKDMERIMGRRIVQVFIADTDENVPLDKTVLYTGTQKLTDATDQELFFEIDIKNILDAHNAYRTTLINKKVKERTENLEPIKIRDLKMVVVNIAEFK